jgi:Zn-dependent protease
VEISISFILALVVSITVHEFCHAWMATYLGDDTARYKGRLTLNPLSHLDPMGTVLLFIAGFGWGKPVPFNPYLLNDPRIGAALISLAGPASNFFLMVVFGFAYHFLVQSGAAFGTSAMMTPYVLSFFEAMVNLNLILMVFNFLPIPPLDGAKIFSLLLPGHLLEKVLYYRNYGYVFLLLVVFSDSLIGVNILGYLFNPLFRFVWNIIL